MKRSILVCMFFITNLLFAAPQKNPYAAGDEYVHQRMYSKAVEEFSKLINKNSKDGIAYYKRGVAYLYMNEFDAAINDFNLALEISPKDADAYNSRGLALSYKGNIEASIDDFDKAIKLDSKFAHAYINRGSAYIVLGDTANAMKDLNQAVKLDSKNPEIYLQRARLYYVKEDFQKSVKEYSSAIALGLGNAKVYFNRGNSYFKLKKYDEAIRDYTKAIELDPSEIDALNNRSYIYNMLGKTKEAEADKKIINEKKNEIFTPIDQLKFKSFSVADNDLTIDLPDTWSLVESPRESPDKYEFIITPENINLNTSGMMVGVTIGVIKNLKKNFNISSEPEILDFWKGSMDKSNEDMLIYKVNWQRHQQFSGHATILNRSTIQASEQHIPFGLFEYAFAWGDNLIYIYFQAPEINFDYFEKLYEIAYKSVKINLKESQN